MGSVQNGARTRTTCLSSLMRAARAGRAAFLALFVFLLSLSAIPVGTAQCATSAPFNQSSCAAFAVTPDPVCVPANYTAVQALLNSYPNCAPLLEAAEARGDGIWLPADPAANATSWALYSVALTQVAAGYFGAPLRRSDTFILQPLMASPRCCSCNRLLPHHPRRH